MVKNILENWRSQKILYAYVASAEADVFALNASGGSEGKTCVFSDKDIELNTNHDDLRRRKFPSLIFGVRSIKEGLD